MFKRLSKKQRQEILETLTGKEGLKSPDQWKVFLACVGLTNLKEELSNEQKQKILETLTGEEGLESSDPWGVFLAYVSLTNLKEELNNEQRQKILEALTGEEGLKSSDPWGVFSACVGLCIIKEQPALKLSAQTEKEQKAIDLWNNQILPKKKEFIVQAKAMYQPFLEIIPEEYQGEIKDKIKEEINRLYNAQEKEIKARLQTALSKEEPLDLDKPLVFDIFSQRMQKILPLLGDYLNSVKPYLSQELYEIKKGYYFDLFIGLFKISQDINLIIESENISNSLFEAAAFGWHLNTQEQFDVVFLINRLITGLKDATDSQIEIAQIRKIVAFLNQASSLNPIQNTLIIKKQLEKILNSKPEVKNKFLKELESAFKEFKQEKLIGFLKNPDKPHNLGKARSFCVFLSQEVEMLEEKEEFVPEGEDITLPEEGVSISQIMLLEEQRKKPEDKESRVMNIDYLLKHIDNLPKTSNILEKSLLRDINLQAEPGSYTREIAQNSKDNRNNEKGELIVSFYLQKKRGRICRRSF